MQTMLELTKAELEKNGVFTPGLNQHVEQVVRSMPSPTIPLPMKVNVALAQLVNFTAQFRRNILLADGTTEVPTNIISFVLSGSGNGKDFAINQASKCFKPGLELINKTKTSLVKKLAIEAATEAGEEMPDEFSVYREYMSCIPPAVITPSTAPGLIKHVSLIGEVPLEAALLTSSELSDELQSNGDFLEILKVLSELFDLGNKSAVFTKGVEGRVGTIEGQSLSALLVGSPGHILFDSAVRKKFEVAFKSKLARRSFFCYSPEKIPLPDFMSEEDPLEAFDKYELSLEAESLQAIASMSELVKTITKYQLSKGNKPITLSKEVVKLFKVFKRYNEELAETQGCPGSAHSLSRSHLQWKSLKVAGSFAIMDCSETVELKHFVAAMRLAELFTDHIRVFELDMNKSSHERLADYLGSIADENGEATITAHELKKLGYTSSINLSRLKELVILATGCDTSGIYTIGEEGSAIHYKAIIKTDSLSVSFKPINTVALNIAVESGDKEALANAKQHIASTTAYGYETADVVFSELAELLKSDFAYSPFKFREGTRGRDNVIGGTKWLVFDVDESGLSASEVHVMLSDINHHISLSSDPSNEYKFRVLLELDAPVDLSAICWKHFCNSIADSLAIKVDSLPQSQIFFSYAGRQVFSQLEAEPLEVHSHVITALDKEANKTVDKVPSTAQSKALRNDPLTTYAYAFECEHNGSRELIRAAYHAQRIGCSLEETQALLTDINDYWVSPMEPMRFKKILSQCERIFQ